MSNWKRSKTTSNGGKWYRNDYLWTHDVHVKKMKTSVTNFVVIKWSVNCSMIVCWTVVILVNLVYGIDNRHIVKWKRTYWANGCCLVVVLCVNRFFSHFALLVYEFYWIQLRYMDSFWVCPYGLRVILHQYTLFTTQKIVFITCKTTER